MTPLVLTAVTFAPVGLGLVALVRFKLRQAENERMELAARFLLGEWPASWQEDLFFTKNQRLAAIASERAALIAERKRLTKNKKRRSHIDLQLRALTNEELRLEGSR